MRRSIDTFLNFPYVNPANIEFHPGTKEFLNDPSHWRNHAMSPIISTQNPYLKAFPANVFEKNIFIKPGLLGGESPASTGSTLGHVNNIKDVNLAKWSYKNRGAEIDVAMGALSATYILALFGDPKEVASYVAESFLLDSLLADSGYESNVAFRLLKEPDPEEWESFRPTLSTLNFETEQMQEVVQWLNRSLLPI